jgi:hypothetical protein
MLNLEAEKEKNGWADDHPEYVARKKSRIEGKVTHGCFSHYH